MFKIILKNKETDNAESLEERRFKWEQEQARLEREHNEKLYRLELTKLMVEEKNRKREMIFGLVKFVIRWVLTPVGLYVLYYYFGQGAVELVKNLLGL